MKKLLIITLLLSIAISVQASFWSDLTSFFKPKEPILGDALSILTVPQGGTGWGNIQSNTLLTGNGTGRLATTSIGTGLSLSGGVLSATGGGAGTVGTSSQETAGQLSYWTTTNGYPALLGGVATSSLAIGASLSNIGTLGSQIGGSASTLSINMANANSWTALQTFANATTTLLSANYASSTLYYGANLANCNTENMLTWTDGKFGCESDTTGAGGTGVGTVSTSSLEVIGNIPYWTSNGAYPATLGTIATGTVSATSPITVTAGRSVIGGALSVECATCALTGTTLTVAGTANQITSSAGAQDLSANRTWTLSLPNHIIFPSSFQASLATTTNATSTNLTISGNLIASGLTSALALTDANGSFGEYTGTSCTNQFVRSLSVLGAATCATVANTDLANSTISGIALGSNLADLTATDGTLTFSGAYNGGTARTVGLNLGNANSWTAKQSFAYASTTQLTLGTTYDSGNSAGSAGQVLSISGGLPVWVATATCLQITGSAGLCDGDDATGAGGGAFAWTPTTNFGQLANSTTTQIWLKGSPISLSASSTSKFFTASATALTLIPLGTAAGTLLAVDPTGLIIATTTPSGATTNTKTVAIGATLTMSNSSPVYQSIPYSGTIQGFTMIGNNAGTSTVEIWKAAYPTVPTRANSIVDSYWAQMNAPSRASIQATSTTYIPGWTTAIAAGDIIAFAASTSVNFSSTTPSVINITLKVLKD